jgi:hypothetical protein
LNTYLFYGVIFLSGGWGYFLGYRRGMKAPKKSALLSSMDLTFSKSAVQEGIRSLGYALVPTSDNDALAMDNGYNAIKADGNKYV